MNWIKSGVQSINPRLWVNCSCFGYETFLRSLCQHFPSQLQNGYMMFRNCVQYEVDTNLQLDKKYYQDCLSSQSHVDKKYASSQQSFKQVRGNAKPPLTEIKEVIQDFVKVIPLDEPQNFEIYGEFTHRLSCQFPVMLGDFSARVLSGEDNAAIVDLGDAIWPTYLFLWSYRNCQPAQCILATHLAKRSTDGWLRTRLSRLAVYHPALSGASCHFDWHDESWFVDCCNKETKSRKCKRHCSFQSRVRAPSKGFCCHTGAYKGPMPYRFPCLVHDCLAKTWWLAWGLALAQSQFCGRASFTACSLGNFWGYWTFAFSGCQWLCL